jgi:uncharacterized protein YjiS (DUF1127 family)
MLRSAPSIPAPTRPAISTTRTDRHGIFWFASLRNVAGTVSVWLRRSRTRRRLAELEDRELRDIGVSRAQALDESKKPFWRL